MQQFWAATWEGMLVVPPPLVPFSTPAFTFMMLNNAPKVRDRRIHAAAGFALMIWISPFVCMRICISTRTLMYTPARAHVRTRTFLCTENDCQLFIEHTQIPIPTHAHTSYTRMHPSKHTHTHYTHAHALCARKLPHARTHKRLCTRAHLQAAHRPPLPSVRPSSAAVCAAGVVCHDD